MELSERRIWTLAVAASFALHGLVLFCAPSLTSGRQDPPVMKVSLVAITASPITKNAVPTPGRSSVVKRQPKQAVVGHPAPALAKKSAVRSVQQLKEKPKAASSSSPVASKPSQFGEAASFQQAGSGSGGGEPAGSGYGGGQGAGPADGERLAQAAPKRLALIRSCYEKSAARLSFLLAQTPRGGHCEDHHHDRKRRRNTSGS